MKCFAGHICCLKVHGKILLSGRKGPFTLDLPSVHPSTCNRILLWLSAVEILDFERIWKIVLGAMQ